ncbi:MAG: 4-phosphoerythronate dehydrogenase [Victivallales bacterium]|nr:4-phosphoerythronate dehydrogenase [Victivallales bacterium]
MKIVIDDKIPFIKGAFEPHAEVLYLPGGGISSEHVCDADALVVRTRTRCDKALLEGSPVKIVATATIGFDHIDTEYCAKSGVLWTSAPGCNSFSVQQYIASALLQLGRQEGWRLKDRTIGIVGLGNVGSKVATFAEAMGMEVMRNDPPLQNSIPRTPICSPQIAAANTRKDSLADKPYEFHTLSQIAREADIISFHVPLERGGDFPTFKLASAAFFCEVRRKPWIINSSRGEVVDGHALRKAILTGEIAGAVLDVWENEPIIDTGLMDVVRFATPHIAGYSLDGKANGTVACVRALGGCLGIGMDDWAPDCVPAPTDREIKIECRGRSLDDVMRHAVVATYDIIVDDKALRADTRSFEKLRGDYPPRREPPAYRVSLKHASAGFADALKTMRFGCIA